MSKQSELSEDNQSAVIRQATWDRMVNGVGIALIKADSRYEKERDAGTYLRGFSIKSPGQYGGEWLVVLKAVIDGEFVVSFQSGDTLYETMKGACNRYVNGSHKWREDQWAGED